jgi:hypothetical protein
MRNEAGESRGFGFVSFQTPDQGPVVSSFSKIYNAETQLPSYRCNARYEWRSLRLQTTCRPLA